MCFYCLDFFFVCHLVPNRTLAHQVPTSATWTGRVFKYLSSDDIWMSVLSMWIDHVKCKSRIWTKCGHIQWRSKVLAKRFICETKFRLWTHVGIFCCSWWTKRIFGKFGQNLFHETFHVNLCWVYSFLSYLWSVYLKFESEKPMTLTHASTLLWDAYTEQTYNHARKIRIWITYLSSLLKSEIHK